MILSSYYNQIHSGPEDAVTSIAAGKIQGFVSGEIRTFLGIPYGKCTGGEQRFRPPRPIESWDDTRPCLTFGPICPQQPRAGAVEATRAYQEEALLLQWRDGVQSEDCLNLNVWTPSLDRNARQPVMIWLHGGHFAFGSSGELPACYGEDLSRRGGVVVVSVNHRLNIFGHLPHLKTTDDQYERSGNVGMLDLILALKWVRDNIENFGGDPDCVTIFGQSGGGAKVATLMAMPAAKGLFHRAIIQSNCALRQCGEEQAATVRSAVLKESAGVDLRDHCTRDLLRLEAAVMRRLALPLNPARRNARIRWEPVVDGIDLLGHSFDAAAPPTSAGIPLMIGTTLNEFNGGIGVPDLSSVTDNDVRKGFSANFGAQADQIFSLFRKKYPKVLPFEIQSRAYSATVRQSAILQAQRQAAQAPRGVYLYWFRWCTPALGGRPGAMHNAELPFVFDTAHRCREWTTGSEAAITLAARISTAWTKFARYGDPNHSTLPEWPAVTGSDCGSMVFDKDCYFDFGSDQDERILTGAA